MKNLSLFFCIHAHEVIRTEMLLYQHKDEKLFDMQHLKNGKLYRTTVCVSVTASVCVIVIMNTYTYILCNY